MSRKIIGNTVGTPINPQVIVKKTNVDTHMENDTIHVTAEEKQGWNNKLDSTKLPEAVNTALAQAKASGEFDGKTPVKGTDYYTEADKTEMVSRVISALPTWNGGSY
jgi:hypothetical protein